MAEGGFDFKKFSVGVLSQRLSVTVTLTTVAKAISGSKCWERLALQGANIDGV